MKKLLTKLDGLLDNKSMIQICNVVKQRDRYGVVLKDIKRLCKLSAEDGRDRHLWISQMIDFAFTNKKL